MKNILKTRAFTLIELLVVIAIIVILTGIILPSLAGSKAKARDAQRVSDLAQLTLALELYFDRCGQYPTADTTTISGRSLIDSNTLTQSTGCPSATPTITFGTYISQVPTPPAGASQATAYDYDLPSSGTPNNYVLHAKLESTNPAVAKGLAAFPSGSWNDTVSCSNNATDYCVGPQ